MQQENQTASNAPVIFVLVAVLLWSTGGFAIKYTSLDAFSVNLGRSLFAAITIAALTFRKGLKPSKYTFFTSLLYAATLSLFVYSTKTTTAANAIFLQYTAPIYILILSPFILKEKFRYSDLITVVICLMGMSLFFLDTETDSSLAPNVFLGNLAALVSGFFFGLYFIFLRHPRALENENPAISVFYGNLLVVFFMLPLVAPNPPAVQTNDLLALIYLGVFQIGIAYLFFTIGLARGVRPLDASIIGFVEPLLNPVWVYFLLGEKPSRGALSGGAVIIAAIFAHTLLSARRKRAGDRIS